jgi:four helix bundle protein
VFDHQRLEVYQRALTVLDLSDEVGRQLPKGRAELREQMERASSSIVANIAEGAGEFSRKEKARFYRIARRSAIELAAWLEITARRREARDQPLKGALAELGIVVPMLVKLIKSCER